ncbi:MAG: T9SS type A sorting domain-containing protein [Candidatus Kapaibacterium sp.]
MKRKRRSVAGNLFNDNTGFSESIIYQLGKNNAYAGTNLRWKLWTDITGSPRYLYPVSYGQQGNYGPGLYFITQSPGSGNSVELYEITDEVGSNPQLTRNQIFKSDYEPSGYAQQLGTTVELITGDCKIINAFYLEGIIHYVFQSDYQSSNYTGINYNRLDVRTLTNVSYSYGQNGFDCAYPTVASYGTSRTDNSVIICYLRSGPRIYPETRVIVFDSTKTWSNSLLVKSGTTYVDAFQYDNTARWGDYTGIAYTYNSTAPEIWVSGCYGTTQKLFTTTYNCFRTWIAQINSRTLSTDEHDLKQTPALQLFPNPMVDFCSIDFTLARPSIVRIDITDMSGSVVAPLFNGQLNQGKNMLTFNRKALSSGVYMVTITARDTVIISKKLIIE